MRTADSGFESAICNPQSLQDHLLDYAGPVIGVYFTAGEFRDQIPDLIRETADVQNVRSLLSLHSRVRLDVDTYHPSLRAAPAKVRPLLHRLCGAAAEPAIAWRINPRF